MRLRSARFLAVGGVWVGLTMGAGCDALAPPAKHTNGIPSQPAPPSLVGIGVAVPPQAAPVVPNRGNSAISPCLLGDELSLPAGAVTTPAEKRCFTRRELLDSVDQPQSADADSDAGASDPFWRCPAATSLDWGVVTEGCDYQPLCRAPISEAVRDEPADAAALTDSHCCYWAARVCGV